MTRQYKLFIQDILAAINDIDEFIGDMDFNTFSEDEKTKSAVVWKINVIGEATKNVPQTMREKYKDGNIWRELEIRSPIFTLEWIMKLSGR